MKRHVLINNKIILFKGIKLNRRKIINNVKQKYRSENFNPQRRMKHRGVD